MKIEVTTVSYLLEFTPSQFCFLSLQTVEGRGDGEDQVFELASNTKVDGSLFLSELYDPSDS
jgi:hypothetical protein